MSIGSLRTLDIRKAKELKVLQLHDQGYSYRKIATSVHLSLRDVTKFINLASNKIESPSLTSIHDEIVLEYRVILLRSQVKDLNIERENLRMNWQICAQKYNLQIQMRAKQSELDFLTGHLEAETFLNEISKDIFTDQITTHDRTHYCWRAQKDE